ncbi:MAG: YaiO family outer membrane beta-barrel protein [Pricia sp.]
MSAQGPEYSGNPDVSFFAARSLAFEGKREVARDTLQKILTKYPEYLDVRSLLASTYSWDGQYERARAHFNTITSKEKKNKDVWVATIKNELYAENFYIALGLANKALTFLEGDEDIMILRSRAINNLHSLNEEPKKRLSEIGADFSKNTLVIPAVDPKITLGPASDIAKDSLESDSKTEWKNNMSISNSFDVFDVVYKPMIYSSLSYTRKTNAGSVIPRINYANRFETHGLQYELDFYPKFSKTFYSYLNYGYSKAPIFPNHRVGAELYANLPKSLETSLGLRYLDFTTTTATVFTGSIGLYHGNYYFSLRPYVTPREAGNLSFSGGLLVRKYLRDRDNFLGVNMGIGYAPELRQFREGDQLLAETVLFIESQRIAWEYQFTGKTNPNSYRVDLGVVRQELVFDSGSFVWSVSAGLTYNVRF